MRMFHAQYEENIPKAYIYGSKLHERYSGAANILDQLTKLNWQRVS